jgi:hypothetical protein
LQLVAPVLASLEGLTHAFSLRLRRPAEETAFAAACGLDGLPLVRLRQVHGARVVRAEEALAAARPLAADALVTGRPDLALAVATADCLPVLLVDPDAAVVGAVHAGWRGLRARVLPATVEAMAALGARRPRLRAAIGPAVQGRCYEVGPDVRAEFEGAFADAGALFEGRRLDLVRTALRELASSGVDGERVSVVALCTHCEPRLASYRRDGSGCGRNLSVIAFKG